MMLDLGDELPDTTVDLSRERVRAFATGLGMGFGRFTDDEQARAEGLPGQIAPGIMSLALIAQTLLRAIPGARLERIGTTFRAPAVAGQTVHVRGTVTEAHESAEGRRVELDVWMENDHGDRLVVGTATLLLSVDG